MPGADSKDLRVAVVVSAIRAAKALERRVRTYRFSRRKVKTRAMDRVVAAEIDIVEVERVEQLDPEFQARALRAGKSTQQAHIQVAHPPVTEHIASEPALEDE